jgi:nucleotide-binding universal stress UspA family protein
MFGNILVALDGSDQSRKAVAVAANVAGPQSEIVLCHVREFEYGRPGGELPTEAPEEAHDLVQEAVVELQASGMEVRGEVRPGTSGGTAKVLLEEAQAMGADLIVVGSRGRSDFAALILGSVAHKVVAHAKCPVLVVR